MASGRIFRVNKGHTQVQLCGLYRITPSFLGNICVTSVNGLHQTHSVRDQASVVYQVLAYLDTNMFLTSASCIDTEIKKEPNLGGDIEELNGGVSCMAFFKEDERRRRPLLPHVLP